MFLVNNKFIFCRLGEGLSTILGVAKTQIRRDFSDGFANDMDLIVFFDVLTV